MPQTLRAAVVQAGALMFDTPGTLRKAVALAEDAAARQARLIVFPEAFIGGYPKGLDFGSVIGGRTPAGREDYRRYADSAIAVPGPETEVLAATAQRLGETPNKKTAFWRFFYIASYLQAAFRCSVTRESASSAFC